MSIPGYPEPFCTTVYADSVCSSITWTEASDENKESALQVARVYIENNFFLNFSESSVPENVQTASALLAEKHLTASLFEAEAALKPAKGLTKTMVDAKGVKTEKSWDPAYSGGKIDPYPEISALLRMNGACYDKNGGGGIYSVPIFRT